MKKLLLLGSVVSKCPPEKHGGTERVAYYQAKHLAKRGVKIIFVGAEGTKEAFKNQLLKEEKDWERIFSLIEIVEIGGGTQFGKAADAIKHDPKREEASRKLRIEMLNLALVQNLMIERRNEYDLVLNNMRGEATLVPLANFLGKTFVNVTHLNIFEKLAIFFKKHHVKIITISNEQQKEFPDLEYIATVYNPVPTRLFTFNPHPKDYALMISTIGYHKNQKDAILACKKVGIPLILAGKIRDEDYFQNEIKPYIDGKTVTYLPELGFEEKLRLYQKAKVFLFPIFWQEPFGLVCIEALSCGTPVIAYPNGGPKEIVISGKNGFLVENWQEMAEKIQEIDKIDRYQCRKDAEERFDEEVIGEKYYQVILKEIKKIKNF